MVSEKNQKKNIFWHPRQKESEGSPTTWNLEIYGTKLGAQLSKMPFYADSITRVISHGGEFKVFGLGGKNHQILSHLGENSSGTALKVWTKHLIHGTPRECSAPPVLMFPETMQKPFPRMQNLFPACKSQKGKNIILFCEGFGKQARPWEGLRKQKGNFQ